MIERYIQITCDCCGEIEWSESGYTLLQFKQIVLSGWKHRGALSLCGPCVRRGKTWRQATLHQE